ncbi:MAG TPA: LCP family protein [Thermomicrobiales bacterium]|jgi:LCP family protein required for cell wall assembly
MERSGLAGWWRRRQRLSRHRRIYRARTRTKLALPGRRPRLAYVFAIVPILAVTVLLAMSPFLYHIDVVATGSIDPTPVALQIEPNTPGEAPVQLPNWDKQERINILLLGIDQREGDEYARTDTMIVVSIDPKAKTIGMLSLPRDLQVAIPGYGDNKINAAYIFGEMDQRPGGGIGLLQKTIRANFGIQIHYYGTVNFLGFEKIVDTFGGVTVDPPSAIVDEEYPTETYGYTNLYFPAGLQHLDGKSALRYARTRHQDLDFGRSQRQQEVILALRQQAVKGNLLNNFYKLFDVLGGAVKTDLKETQIAQLANLGMGISDDRITQYTLQDLLTLDEGADGSSILAPITDWNSIRARVRTMIPDAGANVPTPTPDTGAKIGVRNGTLRDKFAARTVEGLKSRGLSGVTVDTTEVTDVPLPMANTIIYEWNKTDTAILAAKTLGLSENSVRHATGNAPNGVDILIVLGDDATDLVPEAKATPKR